MADEIQNHAAGDSGTPIEATQRFFERLDASAALPPNLSPVDAASSVLCALSLRLPAAEAQALIKSLPTSLRALFTLCVRHRGEAPVSMELGEFLALVADHLQVTETEARGSLWPSSRPSRRSCRPPR